MFFEVLFKNFKWLVFIKVKSLQQLIDKIKCLFVYPQN